jgi:glucokinase
MSTKVFGVDIGGTTVKMGLFTAEGELLDKWEIATRKEDDGAHILPEHYPMYCTTAMPWLH